MPNLLFKWRKLYIYIDMFVYDRQGVDESLVPPPHQSSRLPAHNTCRCSYLPRRHDNETSSRYEHPLKIEIRRDWVPPVSHLYFGRSSLYNVSKQGQFPIRFAHKSVTKEYKQAQQTPKTGSFWIPEGSRSWHQIRSTPPPRHVVAWTEKTKSLLCLTCPILLEHCQLKYAIKSFTGCEDTLGNACMRGYLVFCRVCLHAVLALRPSRQCTVRRRPGRPTGWCWLDHPVAPSVGEADNENDCHRPVAVHYRISVHRFTRYSRHGSLEPFQVIHIPRKKSLHRKRKRIVSEVNVSHNMWFIPKYIYNLFATRLEGAAKLTCRWFLLCAWTLCEVDGYTGVATVTWTCLCLNADGHFFSFFKKRGIQNRYYLHNVTCRDPATNES